MNAISPAKRLVSSLLFLVLLGQMPSLKAADFTVNENEGEVAFTIGFADNGQCQEPNGCALRVFTIDRTARAGVDYRAIEITLNWNEGESDFLPVSVPIIDNNLKDGNRLFVVQANNIVGFSSDLTLEIEIIDDEPPVANGVIQFETDALTVSESGGSATLTVQRLDGSDGAVSVNFSTGAASDTAQSGADYTETSGTLRWQDGDSSARQISIPVLEDSLRENDETLTVILSGVTGGASLGNQSRSVITIQDATSNGVISFTQANVSVAEGSGLLRLQVQRQGGSDGEVSVDYQVGAAGDSATVNQDYSVSQRAGTLNWGDGDNSARSVELSILADTLVEQEEIITVSLLDPSGGAVLGQNSTSSIQIRDSVLSDFTPTINIISGDEQSGFPGTVLDPFVINVEDNGAPLPGVNVSWSVSPSDAGRLINGTSTTSNDSAEASNQLEILTGGIIKVTAVIQSDTASAVQSRTEDDPTMVVFTVNAGFEGSKELNTNQRSVGKSLDSACASVQDSEDNLDAAQQDLRDTCETLENATPAEIQTGVARLAPEEAFAIGTSTIDSSDIQVTNVQSRINTIRLGSVGLDLASFNLNLWGQQIPGYVMGVIGDELTGAGAGDDSPGRLGVFVNGSMSFGSLDETDSEMGLDFDSQGLTFGADYRVSESWVVGGALGLVSHKGDYSSEGGNIDLSGTSLSAFMTWYEEDDAYFDAIVNIGQHDFDIKRRINLPGQPDQFAKSSPSASEISISIGAGLEYGENEWQYGPYGRLSYTQARVDAYREKPTDPDAPGTGSVLLIDDQSLDSSAVVVGGHISKTISTESGVWIPQLRFEVEHKLSDKSRSIDASFVHDPTATEFEIESEDVDTDYANLGIGTSAVFKNGKSGYLYYETRIGQDRLTQNWIKGGFRLEF